MIILKYFSKNLFNLKIEVYLYKVFALFSNQIINHNCKHAILQNLKYETHAILNKFWIVFFSGN